MRWDLQNDTIATTLEELTNILVENRDILNSEKFLNPVHPRSLSVTDVGIDAEQVEKACSLLSEAIEKNKKIVIFGDYDADGLCASAITWLVLKQLGAEVVPFIPDREKHGYGITESALKEVIKMHQPDLILTVDNGIVAHEAVVFAKKQKVTLIISDHHKPDSTDNAADAVVHTTELCGSSVAWMLMRELLDTQQSTKIDVEELLDLVAIATIADQVPLRFANRSFAKFGIQQLRTSSRPAVRALSKASKVTQDTISEGTIGYQLAPRINAAGRVGDSLVALRLLCTGSMPVASKYATQLDTFNQKRQSLTITAFEAAESAISDKDDSLYLLLLPEVHEGIIGLVAGRIAQKFSRPTVILTNNGDTLKGSARSIDGVDITALLRTYEDSFISLGGHAMAAGFSISEKNFKKIQPKLLKLAKDEIPESLLQPSLHIEAQLSDSLLNLETVALVESFSPFGSENTSPSFVIHNLEITSSKTMGSDGQHCKLYLESESGVAVEAVWWRAAHRLDEEWSTVSVVAKLEKNSWRGKDKFQLMIRDVQSDLQN